MEKVPHVQRIRRSNGRVDLYFRKGEHRRGPLVSPDGSPELKTEVETILAQISRVDAASTPVPGTIGGMLAEYSRSTEFLSLARSTQSEYHRLINEMTEDCGDVLLRQVTLAWLKDIREIWFLRGHKAANDRRQVLKNALAPAIDDERILNDPFSRLKKLKRPHDAGESHPIWEDAEIDAAIALALSRHKPGLARAIALGRWGGFRRHTICTIPLNARTSGYGDRGHKQRRLYWITEKRKVLADKREDPRLTALLNDTPNRSLTIAYNALGEPWKARQLNQAFDRLVDTMAKLGTGRETLTIHGLRHSRGVELAQAGASDAEIMSQLEHATDRAAKIYRRQADRRKMADAGQDRVDKVVNLRERRRRKEIPSNGT